MQASFTEMQDLVCAWLWHACEERGCGQILALHGCLPVRSAVAGVLGTRGGLLGDWMAWKSLTLSMVDWSADKMPLDMRAAFRPTASCPLSDFGLLAASVLCLLQGAAFSLCSQTLFCCIPRCVGLILRLQSCCKLDVLAFLFVLVRQWPGEGVAFPLTVETCWPDVTCCLEVRVLTNDWTGVSTPARLVTGI